MGNFHSLLFGEARTAHDQQRPETKRYLFGSYNICENVDHVVIAIPELERTSVSKEIKADSSVFTVRETTETDANEKDDGEREVTKNVTMEVSIRDDHETVQENSSVVGTVEKRRKRKNVKTVMVVDEAVRWIKHYSSSHEILLVGEGDFSFSACLAMAFKSASNMIATSLDSEEFLMENYQKAKSNIEELISRGAQVMHGIDATEMANHYSLRRFKFDRIVFNFPFAGFFNESRNLRLRRHRRLVSKFLMNAKEMIREDGEIHISHKTSGFHNEWNLESIASSHGLRLIKAVTFSQCYYKGYNTKYGFGGDDNFNCQPSKTFKFALERD